MKAAEEIGVCEVCIRRLDGQRNSLSAPLSLPSTTTSAGSSVPSAPVCPLCLGLFQQLCTFQVDLRPPSLTAQDISNGHTGSTTSTPRLQSFTTLPEAITALRAAWSFDTFALEVSMPACIAVRSQAAKWTCQHDADAPDVKEGVRRVYSHRIAATANGPTFDPQAGMRLVLSCSLDATTETEAAWVLPEGAGGGGGKAGGRKRNRFKRGQQPQENNTAAAGPAGGSEVPATQLLASAAVVARLSAMSQEEFFQNCPVSAAQLAPPPAPAVLVITPYRLPVHIGGRYLKLRRGIPQSFWMMDGERRGESSVQEEIAKIVVPLLGADCYTFLSSGREDIDVRMLGTGRPFALEICSARNPTPSPEQFTAAAAAVEAAGGGVAVTSLRNFGPVEIAALKDTDGEKKKQYAAVCWIPRPVTEEDLRKLSIGGGKEAERVGERKEERDVQGEALGEGLGGGEETQELVLRQKTPVRVLHRRANLERLRSIYQASAEALPDLPGGGYFLLRMTTQAGTYVKEFVNGDRGRTKPSVMDILGTSKAECVYLDVVDVLDASSIE